jgi:hypothetical protein
MQLAYNRLKELIRVAKASDWEDGDFPLLTNMAELIEAMAGTGISKHWKCARCGHVQDGRTQCRACEIGPDAMVPAKHPVASGTKTKP